MSESSKELAKSVIQPTFAPIGIKPDQLGNNKLSDIEHRLRIIERQINAILMKLNHLSSRSS